MLFEKHGSSWITSGSTGCFIKMVFLGKKIVDARAWDFRQKYHECEELRIDFNALDKYDEVLKLNAQLNKLNNILSFLEKITQETDDVSDSQRVQGFRDVFMGWNDAPITIDDDLSEICDRCKYIPRFGSVYQESEERFAALSS